MILIPWSRSYRSKIIRCQTEVAIDIGIHPVHACYQHCLEPLLSSYCKIKTCTFNTRRGTCRVVGLALKVQSIPSDGSVALQYDDHTDVSMEAFPVTMRTYLLAQAPEFRNDPSPHDSPASPDSFDTECGVDPEVLQEAYEEQRRANQELENAWANSLGAALYSSASSSGPSDISDDGWESERSWHLRYGQ
ncbi:uncharacterized protein [Miscanthus floridulus]|uniref:uncharacterized protein isoform X2 n=1 Tax=Miscanthus floridulus TaxID=154761 RepID=UPI00345B369D